MVENLSLAVEWKFSLSLINILYPHFLKGEGVYCFTSVRLSVRPSKIIFVAFFSVTVDGRNLIFGHKLHIGTPYRFWTHQIPTSCCRFSWSLYTFNIHLYMHIFCRIFLSNYWWQDSYFLFAEERGYHRWALAHSSSCCICYFSTPAYAAALGSLLRQYKSSFKTYVIPCYIASGKCGNPGELPYRLVS